MIPAIQVSELSVSYHGQKAIQRADLIVEKGKLVGIIGPNGAGKSTFVKAMLSLISRDGGTVRFQGKSFKEMRTSIAYMPQRNEIDWDFPITVFDTVLIGTYPTLGFFKNPGKKEKEWARVCLKKVGMEPFSKKQIGELSGGQQQRVFLARALAQKAEILFLDEPFAGVDVASEAAMIALLKELAADGKTILVVHHDLSKATEYFDQLLLLNKKVIGFGDAETVFKRELLCQAYVHPLSFLDQKEMADA
ncbi:metal ABC transporter ATP-binding protein [Domibacillus sp. A3M-37]|uniref:metal ABC transporter ATP-binding protein n=1 Tax=Domibacillus sp. A3M-37 TaxID=2962037 RepID=UPI0020B6B348|nr:metal ABC transporter ATP-binding protein [Domibacillus sp. A3M-37]MCP3764324.1 metal ABC transporter ATP-binding protein [Domibacillus sp. A3M-37]